MPLRKWEFTDAKNRFSELIELAIKEGPQEVIKLGDPIVVFLSYAKYQELIQSKNNLVKFFEKSPFFGLEIEFKSVKDTSSNEK